MFLKWKAITALIFSFFVLISCSEKAKEEKKEIPKGLEVKPQVLVAISDNKAIHQYVESEGIIEAAQQLNIVSRESGYLIKQHLVDGSVIQKNEVLFELDQRSMQLRIKEAEIALKKTIRDFNVELTMRKNSGRNPDQAMIQALRIQYGVDEAQIKLDDLKLSAEFMSMKAPFSGKLSIPETKNLGDFISAGTVLGKLIQPEKYRLKLFVLQNDASKIKQDQWVLSEKLDTLGRISSISPVIDEKTQSVSVWVQLVNGQRFMHGERIKARIIIGEVGGQVRVPRSSVLERDNRWVVFKIKNEQAQWVYVTPLAVNREWAVVEGKGLASGDTVAFDRHFTLSHLQKVIPIFE